MESYPGGKHRQWDKATTKKQANHHVDNYSTAEHLHPNSEECMES